MTARLAVSAALTFAVALPWPLQAQPQEDLADALQVSRIIDIMQQEGVRYGDEIASDMLGAGPTPSWRATVNRIYDARKMEAVVRDTLSEALPDAEAVTLLDFYRAPLGVRVVTLEAEAREAMVDPDIEQAARESYRELAGSADPGLARVESFVAANELVERNVEGALNASLMFYRGLSDGGALDMSEDEMLSDVWSQEPATRSDTSEWLYGFLLMAYEPLSDAEMGRYVEMSESAEGEALNRALFAAFNAMYDDLSYAMGLAVARQMAATEL